MTAKIANYSPKLKIFEIGGCYDGRTYQEGKKIGWKDGIRALYCIIKYNIFWWCYKEKWKTELLNLKSKYERLILPSLGLLWMANVLFFYYYFNYSYYIYKVDVFWDFISATI